MFGILSIRSKLLVLLAVSVAGSVLLGVAGVAGAWGHRVRAAAWVAGDGQDGQGELRSRRRRVDGALAEYRAGVAGLGPTGDPALDQAVAVATERLDRLALVRVEVDRRLVTPARAMAGHDAMVDALLGVARGLAAELEAPAPPGRPGCSWPSARPRRRPARNGSCWPPPRLRRAPRPGCCGCTWPPPPPWPARSSTASGRPPAPALRRSTGPSGCPAPSPPGDWSWPCSTRPPGRRPWATWTAGGPG